MESYKGKNVIVTGASGDIGSKVAKKLYRAGVRKLVLFVRATNPTGEKHLNNDHIAPIHLNWEDSNFSTTQVFYKNVDFRFSHKMSEDINFPNYARQGQLKEETQLEAQFKSAMKDLEGKLDHVFICHGIVSEKNMLNSNSLEEFDKTMLINVRSVTQFISFAFPFLKASQNEGYPSVTVLTSAQGMTPDPSSSFMSIAGAMLKQLVQCTALEGANFNVRVNGVAAGVTATKAREKKESTLTPGKELRENQMILK